MRTLEDPRSSIIEQISPLIKLKKREELPPAIAEFLDAMVENEFCRNPFIVPETLYVRYFELSGSTGLLRFRAEASALFYGGGGTWFGGAKDYESSFDLTASELYVDPPKA